MPTPKESSFRPVRNNFNGDLDKSLSPDAVYQNTIRYAEQAGIHFRGLSPHALRATAATTALEKGADIAKVQDWRTCQRLNHQALRQAPEPSRGESDV